MSRCLVRRLGTEQLAEMRGVNRLFATEFDDEASYAAAPPPDSYLRRLLSNEHCVVLCAEAEGAVIGALVAYELEKFEQARSEFYIYDLAVARRSRRQGVATALIEALRAHAASRGGWVIFVQADHVDPPAIALYEKLGVREEVLHFDIAVKPG